MGKGRSNNGASFERCFDIITRMNAGQIMSAAKIAELYNLNIRQGYRVLKAIETSLPVIAVHEWPLKLKLMEK